MAGARSSGAAAGQLGSLFTLGAAGDLTDGQLLERFLTRDDPTAAEAAFTALVDRHGAMVLGVCCRELGDPHDAHDAFQATFLVLVSKAAALRHWETVGGWLVGIARRVAARSRVEGARRRRHTERAGIERAGAVMMPADDEPDYRPLIAEVERLPERFRAPVVLHYFEGLSTEATAQRLGCARGTILSRLARARSRLRVRLERRGFSPALLLPVGEIVTRWLPPEPVPPSLAQGTVRAAGSLGLAGAAIESVVPAAVAKLSRRVARTLALSRAGMAASMILLAVAGVSIGLAATLRPADEPQQGQAMERPKSAIDNRPAPRADRPTNVETVVLRGRVLDPDGKPAGGASILLDVREVRADGSSGPRRVGSAGADGQFELTVPRTSVEPPNGSPNPRLPKAVVGAAMPGVGLDWMAIDPARAGEPIALQLRRDDVPIRGHIIDLEGRPVGGLSVRVVYVVKVAPSFLAQIRETGGTLWNGWWSEMQDTFLPPNEGILSPVRTEADGRFRMSGFGRDRVALLSVEGPSVERTQVMVLTTGDPSYKPVRMPAAFGTGQRKIEGPQFDLAIGPGRVIEGTITDRDTGQPIAGASVRAFFGDTAATDAQGRFRVEGQPAAGERSAKATVEGQPYISASKAYHDAGGIGPVRIDLALKRGVWVEGRVIDGSTGKPVQANVVYYPLRDNPNVKDYPDATLLSNNSFDDVTFSTDANGRFRAVAIPGGGILIVRAAQPGYRDATFLDTTGPGNIIFAPEYMSPYHAAVRINAPAGKTLAVPDIALTPGRTQHIRIVDPEGRPVRGAHAAGIQGLSSIGDVVPGDELALIHNDPGKARSVIIFHPDRSLGATVELKGDETEPIRVVLRPMATVTGRLVDEDARPRPAVHLAIDHEFTFQGDRVRRERIELLMTGPDGRFRIKGLVPGVSYGVSVIRPNEPDLTRRVEGYLHEQQWTAGPGEDQDWGDVQVRSGRR